MLKTTRHLLSLFVFGLLILSFSVPKAIAEPSRVVNHLMDEPISMWDFGLYKMGKFFDGVNYAIPWAHGKSAADHLKDATFFTSLTYEWDSNRILISINVILFEDPVPEANHVERRAFLKKLVTNGIVRKLRHYHSVYDVDGKVRSDLTSKGSTLDTYFRHFGYKRKSASDITKELDSIVNLEVSLGTWGGGEAGTVKASCRLIDSKDEVYFQ